MDGRHRKTAAVTFAHSVCSPLLRSIGCPVTRTSSVSEEGTAHVLLVRNNDCIFEMPSTVAMASWRMSGLSSARMNIPRSNGAYVIGDNKRSLSRTRADLMADRRQINRWRSKQDGAHCPVGASAETRHTSGCCGEVALFVEHLESRSDQGPDCRCARNSTTIQACFRNLSEAEATQIDRFVLARPQRHKRRASPPACHEGRTHRSRRTRRTRLQSRRRGSSARLRTRRTSLECRPRTVPFCRAIIQTACPATPVGSSTSSEDWN